MGAIIAAVAGTAIGVARLHKANVIRRNEAALLIRQSGLVKDLDAKADEIQKARDDKRNAKIAARNEKINKLKASLKANSGATLALKETKELNKSKALKSNGKKLVLSTGHNSKTSGKIISSELKKK